MDSKVSIQHKKILLMGIGNVLLTDEGAGVHTVNRLREEGLPAYVEPIDGGTAGPGLAYILGDANKLIIVDCLDAGAEPGSIFRINYEDILENKESTMSFHELGLAEVLTIAQSLDSLPEMVIFGIQPKSIDWGFGLSPVVEQKIPEFMDILRDEFKQ